MRSLRHWIDAAPAAACKHADRDCLPALWANSSPATPSTGCHSTRSRRVLVRLGAAADETRVPPPGCSPWGRQRRAPAARGEPIGLGCHWPMRVPKRTERRRHRPLGVCDWRRGRRGCGSHRCAPTSSPRQWRPNSAEPRSPGSETPLRASFESEDAPRARARGSNPRLRPGRLGTRGTRRASIRRSRACGCYIGYCSLS